MNKKKIIVFIAVFIGICGFGSVTYTSYIYSHKFKENMMDYSENKKDKESYVLSLLDTHEKSEVISSIITSSKIVCLSFEGIDDDETMTRVLELLDKYNIKATFIVSGIDAAENSDMVKKITDQGHEIGNGSLNNKENLDEKSKEDLIHDFSKSNKIIEDIIKGKVKLLRCKATEYTDDILEAAYASGNEYVLDSNIHLNYQSFKNYEEVYGYVKHLKNGSILSVKLNGVLDETEYSKRINDEKPSIDKQAGIKEKDDEEKQQVTTPEMLEWLLRAISQNKKAVVKVTDLVNIIPDNNLIIDNYNSIYNYNYSQVNRNTKKVNKPKVKTNNDEQFNEEKNEVPNVKNEELLNIQHKNEVNLNDINFKKIIEDNNNKMADVNSEIYTTKNSVTYTFRGLTNEKALNYALESLKNVNGKGTFFVTKDEIEKYPERINKIIEYGNEIGNGGITNSSKLLSKTPEDIAKEIYEVGIMLKNRGIKTNAYMPGYGYINENVTEALSALKSLDDFKDYELFRYTKSPIIGKYKGWKADDIICDYFNINTYLSLRKGEIVYFRLDSELFDDYMTIGYMIKNLTQNYVENGYINRFDSKNNLYVPIKKRLGYSVVSLGELQEINEMNSKRYKLNNYNIRLPQRSVKEADAIMKNNYIGNIYVDLEGFDDKEKSQMDTGGFVNTNGESTIFMTFDDWGSDVVINEILDVLDKHNVKGTFFVLGKYVDVESGISNANPNLLRTIALKGNDIGSHTYDHDKFDTNSEELWNSMNNSYMAINKVVGDLSVLKPYLRPPTLFTTKAGLETAFQYGYDYVINGNISTHDYEASSSEELLYGIESELVKGKGNIVVMHMNNQASYTAEALDKFLTKNEQGLYGTKYKVAKLSDYLN